MTESIVFIVSEDVLVRESVRTLIESTGLQVASFPALQALLDAKEPASRGCLVFYPQNNLLDEPVQQAILATVCAGRPGVLITERGNVSAAVQALKAGITTVVQKPYRDRDLLGCIVKMLEAATPV
jgi:FixJ family two-component response regulator